MTEEVRKLTDLELVLYHSLVDCIKILQEHMGNAVPNPDTLKCKQCSPKFEVALKVVTDLQLDGFIA